MPICHVSENRFIAAPGSGVQILGGRSPGCLIFVGSNMDDFSCHLSGAQNFEVDRRILENLCTLRRRYQILFTLLFVVLLDQSTKKHTRLASTATGCDRKDAVCLRKKMTDCHPVPMDVHSHSEIPINYRICGYMARHNKK